MTSTEPSATAPVAEAFAAMRERVGTVVVGQEEPLRLAFLTLLCAAHSILEGVPGVAKTLLVRSLARAVGVNHGRIQFTPDLMPSDITGVPVLQPASGEFRFRPGPVFTDILLADEINRASAKTQAALLEGMQERSVTVDGSRHALGPYFTVFATQNPVEHEGTYPLPEAQLDRFLFKIEVDYPSDEEERRLLRLHHVDGSEEPALEPVFGGSDLGALRSIVAGVGVRDDVLNYVAALVRATRSDVQYALGGSPRSAVMLLRAAKANAAVDGRTYVLPEDVQALWIPTLGHRVILDPGAEVEGLSVGQALGRTLASLTVPR